MRLLCQRCEHGNKTAPALLSPLRRRISRGRGQIQEHDQTGHAMQVSGAERRFEQIDGQNSRGLERLFRYARAQPGEQSRRLRVEFW